MTENNKVVRLSKKPSIKPKLDASHLEELANSGIPVEIAIKNGVKSITDFPKIKQYLKDFGISTFKAKDIKSLLVFPYRSMNGDSWQPRLKTFPPINFTDEEGKEKARKYLQAKGSDNHLYLPVGVEPASETPIWITEGEKKALCLTHNGFSCIGISGVWNWKGKDDEGTSLPIADFDLINWQDREVNIVFDADKAINPQVLNAEKALAGELSKRGAKVLIVDLPHGEDEPKGVDDFIVKYGKDEFRKLDRQEYKRSLSLSEAINGPKSLSMTWGEFSDLDLPKREYILQGAFPLEKGSVSFVSSPAGAGKTMFLLEVAKMLGTGGKGLADTCYSPDVFPVLYIDGELPPYELKERAEMFGLNDLRHLTVMSKIYFEIMDVTPVLNLNQADVRDELTKYIIENKFALVIIDNLFSLFGGMDLNSAEAWEPVNGWLMRLRSKNVASFIAHHTGKGGDQLGSIMKLANLNNALILKPETTGDDDEHCCFSVQIQKQRGLGNKLPGNQFHFKDGKWWKEVNGENDEMLCQIALLLDEGKSFQVIADKLYPHKTEEDRKKNKSLVNRKKDILLKKKYIEKWELRFRLTDSGRIWTDTFKEDY